MKVVFLVFYRGEIVSAHTSLGLANNFIKDCVSKYLISLNDFTIKFIELNSKTAHFYFYE